VYYLTNDLDAGKQRCQIGLEISKDLGDPWGIAASLINLGDIACKMEKFQDSKAFFKEASHFVIELHSEPLEIEILVGMATLLAETGNEESALELLSPILRHPPDDKEIRERVNKLLDKLASSLCQATVIEIQTKNSDKSIEAAVRQLFH
jgi:tetratricopeptide (TPR) repeat protein